MPSRWQSERMVGLRNMLQDMRRGNPEENEDVYSSKVRRKGMWNTGTIANMQHKWMSSRWKTERMVGLRNMLQDMRRGNPEENKDVYSSKVRRKGVWNTTATIAIMQHKWLSSRWKTEFIFGLRKMLEDMRRGNPDENEKVYSPQERRKAVWNTTAAIPSMQPK